MKGLCPTSRQGFPVVKNILLLSEFYTYFRFSYSVITNQKVAGSIPDGVMEFFIDINSSDRTIALGSTQPLTEMSTGSISWG
jgi:hypothetical protein